MSEMKCPFCHALWTQMNWRTNPQCYREIECYQCNKKWVLVN